MTMSTRRPIPLIAFLPAMLVAASATAMQVATNGSWLTVTGAGFRYTWDTHRGGELAIVEQAGSPVGGWWNRFPARGGLPPSPGPALPGFGASSVWQRVNSTFAWKSLDTIPALSFSTKRGSYYSGEWNVAYANVDRNATLKILEQSADQVVFETQSRPKILENTRMPVPWQVHQLVRVFDSGVVLTTVEITLPKGEVYELDWAQMSVDLDDTLYKEPHPERQEAFAFGWGFPGEGRYAPGRWKNVLQALSHLPLDIDVKPEQIILTTNPVLCASAAYDLTHIQGAAQNGFAECCLEEANSLVGTREDFGSRVLIRPQSGMSPVPTWAGSMRDNTCFEVGWNLFDGSTRGLNDPLLYHNTLAFATASRKRSSLTNAPPDDRNVLIGARVYYARDKTPTADDVKAMAAEGCDTLILGRTWQTDGAAAVQAAHAAGMRVGVTVDLKNIKSLVTDGSWFTRLLTPNRDGLFVLNANYLLNAVDPADFDVAGVKVSFRQDGVFRANGPSFAVCMKALRRIVGDRGFLIGDPSAPSPALLSLAEFDLHANADLNAYRWGTPQDSAARRHRAGAGFAPLTDSLPADMAGMAAMHGDTPVVLWPAKDKSHLTWWQVCRQLPDKGCRIESDLLPTERRFTTSSADVHGTLFDGGAGRAVLLLTSAKGGAAQVAFTAPVTSVKTLDGTAVNAANNAFDTGSLAPWQIKGFEVAIGAK